MVEGQDQEEEENQGDLNNPDLFLNRELSLLEFQRRVLEEGLDENNPLLERVKFLAFVGNNLDEFYMVSVAGLKKQIAAGVVDSLSRWYDTCRTSWPQSARSPWVS